MKQTILGLATLNYAQDGTPTAAIFEPSVHVTDTSELRQKLMEVAPKTPDEAKSQAQMVFASWFSNMSKVELADREHNRVDTRMMECVKWPDGRPRMCVFEFVFVEELELEEVIGG